MNDKRMRMRRRKVVRDAWRLPWLVEHRVAMLARALDFYIEGKVPAEYVGARADKARAVGAFKR
ncbi:MAG: hypothetical protein Q8O40_13300 [Chloroflexota bacterium]|nr:hypothetical protein [Chloroflexota bacterium]